MEKLYFWGQWRDLYDEEVVQPLSDEERERAVDEYETPAGRPVFCRPQHLFCGLGSFDAGETPFVSEVEAWDILDCGSGNIVASQFVIHRPFNLGPFAFSLLREGQAGPADRLVAWAIRTDNGVLVGALMRAGFVRKADEFNRIVVAFPEIAVETLGMFAPDAATLYELAREGAPQVLALAMEKCDSREARRKARLAAIEARNATNLAVLLGTDKLSYTELVLAKARDPEGFAKIIRFSR